MDVQDLVILELFTRMFLTSLDLVSYRKTYCGFSSEFRTTKLTPRLRFKKKSELLISFALPNRDLGRGKGSSELQLPTWIRPVSTAQSRRRAFVS